MTNDEKSKKQLQLLTLKAIADMQRELNAGRIVKLNDRGKRMKVTVDTLKFTQANSSFTLTDRQMKTVLNVIKSDILKRTPVDTRQLKDSISIRVLGANKGEVYIRGKRNNEVARYQHFGTEAHFVAPVKAKALSWVMGGKRFFSQGHEVSGIVATYFFEPSAKALTYVRNLIKGYIKDNLNINFRRAA